MDHVLNLLKNEDICRMIAKKDRLNAIIWVLIAGVFITLLKFYAYYLTHSNAILTDALENIINIIAGSFAFYSIYSNFYATF